MEYTLKRSDRSLYIVRPVPDHHPLHVVVACGRPTVRILDGSPLPAIEYLLSIPALGIVDYPIYLPPIIATLVGQDEQAAQIAEAVIDSFAQPGSIIGVQIPHLWEQRN